MTQETLYFPPAIDALIEPILKAKSADPRKIIAAARPKRTKAPSLKTAERWMDDGVARATDGCRVEPDGHCEHGCPSWLLELGLI